MPLAASLALWVLGYPARAGVRSRAVSHDNRNSDARTPMNCVLLYCADLDNWQKVIWKDRASISAGGLEAKTNGSTRPCVSVAVCRPCPTLSGFGGGVESDEITVSAAAYACKKGTSHESPFRA